VTGRSRARSSSSRASIHHRARSRTNSRHGTGNSLGGGRSEHPTAIVEQGHTNNEVTRGANAGDSDGGRGTWPKTPIWRLKGGIPIQKPPATAFSLKLSTSPVAMVQLVGRSRATILPRSAIETQTTWLCATQPAEPSFLPEYLASG
jgi:hypothetical protein